MLSVHHLDIRYGEKHLFRDVSVQVYSGNRIGLVGVNGAGKSTLLKIMGGISAADDGVVSCSRHFSIGYLAQESDELFSKKSLLDEAKSAFKTLLDYQSELDDVLQRLGDVHHETDEAKELLARQGELQHVIDTSDIYTIDGKIEKVLLGLGFSRDDMDKPVSSFSGGWQMRVKLAKMLLEEPSLLLLDEPTNHLDLDSLTWLEKFLQNYKGAMVLISHDRTFLDKVTGITWEISLGRLDIYKGNYSYYLQEREERRAIERGAWENQQAKIKQTMKFVEKFRAKATKARQVQSRVKQLEKMERIELGEEEMQIRFHFPPAPDSGRDVLRVEGVSKTFGDKQVFRDVDLLFSRGDKVAVVGVNGAGKSTFLKILAGKLDCDQGTLSPGANVRLTYFGQHQAQELSHDYTVLETMATAGEEMTITRTRSLLGAFLFRGEDVDKKVSVLSGGEKSRLALAKMISVPANCMLLDEPTNHLDISSQEVLQEAMAQYDGTIIVVSHNRYFVDSFVNKVLEVKDGRLTLYEGSVSEYVRRQEELRVQEEEKQRETARETVTKSADDQSSSGRREKKRQEALLRQERSKRAGPWLKKLAEAEKEVEQYELLKEELEAAMAAPELYGDENLWAETSQKYNDCCRRLERWYDKWEKAQEEVDRIDQELAARYD